MNEEPKCSECSRRKFYQQGYEDGKKENDWIPVSSGHLPKHNENVLLQEDTEDELL